MKKVIYCWLVFTLFIGLILGAAECNAISKQDWPKNIIIGSYGAGSATYFVASALGVVIDKYTPANSLQRGYSGGLHALTLMKRGQLHIMINNAQETSPAYYAVGSFKGEKPYEINNLMTSFMILCGPMTTEKTKIYKMEDLVGKKILVIGPETGPNVYEFIEKNLLKYYGILDKVTMVSWTSPDQIQNDMIEGRADAIFAWGVETPATQSIAHSVGIRLIPVSEEAIKYCQNLGATMVGAQVPARTLETLGIEKDLQIHSFAVPMGVIVKRDLPDNVVYETVKAFHEHFDEIKGIHYTVAQTTLQRSVENSGMPFHPGAIKYYKEKGVWGPEEEQRQSKQLSKPRGK